MAKKMKKDGHDPADVRQTARQRLETISKRILDLSKQEVKTREDAISYLAEIWADTCAMYEVSTRMTSAITDRSDQLNLYDFCDLLHHIANIDIIIPPREKTIDAMDILRGIRK